MPDIQNIVMKWKKKKDHSVEQNEDEDTICFTILIYLHRYSTARQSVRASRRTDISRFLMSEQRYTSVETQK